MGTTPNLGIVYPDPSGAPSRQAWVEDPIKSVDTQVKAYVEAFTKGRYRSGVTPVTTAANGTALITVTLPGGPMVAAPNVTVSFSTLPGGTLAGTSQIRADSFTPSTFRVIITGANASTVHGIAWTAVVN